MASKSEVRGTLVAVTRREIRYGDHRGKTSYSVWIAQSYDRPPVEIQAGPSKAEAIAPWLDPEHFGAPVVASCWVNAYVRTGNDGQARAMTSLGFDSLDHDRAPAVLKSA